MHPTRARSMSADASSTRLGTCWWSTCRESRSESRNTAVIERQYLRFIRKYQRYEKRTHRMNVHAPPCLGLQIGHRVLAMECRPLGKTVHFVAIHNQGVAG